MKGFFNFYSSTTLGKIINLIVIVSYFPFIKVSVLWRYEPTPGDFFFYSFIYFFWCFIALVVIFLVIKTFRFGFKKAKEVGNKIESRREDVLAQYLTLKEDFQRTQDPIKKIALEKLMEKYPWLIEYEAKN